MSCDGRTFADVARKILYSQPLRYQRIAKTDSTFGIYGPKGDLVPTMAEVFATGLSIMS